MPQGQQVHPDLVQPARERPARAPGRRPESFEGREVGARGPRSRIPGLGGTSGTAPPLDERQLASDGRGQVAPDERQVSRSNRCTGSASGALALTCVDSASPCCGPLPGTVSSPAGLSTASTMSSR